MKSVVQFYIRSYHKSSRTLGVLPSRAKAMFEKALCDLGASINLMTLTIFRKLGLGEARLTIVTL